MDAGKWEYSHARPVAVPGVNRRGVREMTTTAAIERPDAVPKTGTFSSLPTTMAGRVSMWIAVVFVVLFTINSFVFMPMSGTTNNALDVFRERILPYYGVGMLLCGAVAGSVALFAITRNRERSFVLWLALLPLAFTIFLLLGEFLVPH